QLIAQITIAVAVRTTTTVRTTLEQLLQLVVEIAVALAVAEEGAEVDLGLAAAPVTEQVLEDVVDIGVAAAVPAAEAATATAALQRLRVVERRQIRLRAEVGVLEVAHRLACRLVQQVHDFLDVIVDVTIGLLPRCRRIEWTGDLREGLDAIDRSDGNGIIRLVHNIEFNTADIAEDVAK